ncbi:unnamed protein product [Paramecium octaurelia]|uniref:Uncharacterized protein n=1 Tax=Paramecium octaurelia TaxID=43137 RepID=A0A8S1TA71_PAROT|nr:unnamed protein product [Paramecium octaurelia]
MLLRIAQHWNLNRYDVIHSISQLYSKRLEQEAGLCTIQQ